MVCVLVMPQMVRDQTCREMGQYWGDEQQVLGGQSEVAQTDQVLPHCQDPNKQTCTSAQSCVLVAAAVSGGAAAVAPDHV